MIHQIFLFAQLIIIGIAGGNVLDCTSLCTLLPDATAIEVGKMISTMTLSTNFKVKFDVLLSSLAQENSEARNILEIRDENSGTSLLKIGTTVNRSLRLLYNNEVLSYYSASVVADYSTTYTTVIAGIYNGWVFLATSNDFTYIDSVTISNQVVTGATVFSLYTSCTADESNPSASGFIRNIQISGLSFFE